MELLFAAAFALAVPDRTVVTQTACAGLDGQSVEAAKQHLVLAARRGAVEQLFAGQVTSLTQVENLALQKDQIEGATVGYVRQEGEATFFNGQRLGELCVTIHAYTTEADRAAVDHVLHDLVESLRRAHPRLVLATDLDQLGLGGRITAAVEATPADVLDGTRCTWSSEPANLLSVSPADGACRVEVAMPEVPLRDRGATIPARLAVRVERGGQLLDALSVRGTVLNAVALEPVASAAILTPGGSVAVQMVPHGRSGPLPPGFTCSWTFDNLPLAFTPTVKDGCSGTLALKPEDAWSPPEGLAYSAGLQESVPVFTVLVRVLYGGDPADQGGTPVVLAYRDPRDPATLTQTFKARMSEWIKNSLEHEKDRPLSELALADADARLVADGLPPFTDLSTTTLALGLDFERDRGELALRYTGSRPVSIDGPLDRYSGLLHVLYSRDGKNFAAWGLAPGLKSLRDLESADHVWVKLGPASHSVMAGPFRLAFDYPTAVRAGLDSAWRALPERSRQHLACSGFVVGGEPDSILSQHGYLATVDEVAVGRPGGLWRSHRYDARIEHLFDRKFERVEPPVGPSSYAVRLTFANGRKEEFSCAGPSYSPIPEGGHYVRLARSAKSGSAPAEIEVYLVETPSEGLTVWYCGPGGGGDFRSPSPATVRVSTDGTTFHSFEQTNLNRCRVGPAKPMGRALVLRFVTAAGELEYRGNTDFHAAPRAATSGG